MIRGGSTGKAPAKCPRMISWSSPAPVASSAATWSRDSAQRASARIRAVDVKPLGEWYQKLRRCREPVGDLARLEPCRAAAKGAVMIYNLAADMGGMGFIETNKAAVHALGADHTHMLVAAQGSRHRSASSIRRRPASTRPTSRPTPTSPRSKEEDAYPAMPEDGYGWEKLFSERMARHFMEDFGIADPRGPLPQRLRSWGTYDGGREKAPAAICRKVIAGASCRAQHEIEIWGDGEQTRSFMYIDDCVTARTRLAAERRRATRSTSAASELVTINQLVRHRREDRRHQAEAQLQARRAEGRARPQQRQHAHHRS